jgi:hypothetical protein
VRFPIRTTLAAVVASIALSVPAAAVAKGGAKTGRKPAFLEACKEDRERFCGDVKLGQGRLLLCLKEHQEELKPDCMRFYLADREPTKL